MHTPGDKRNFSDGQVPHGVSRLSAPGQRPVGTTKLPARKVPE